MVVSTQHSEKVTLEALRKDIMEKVSQEEPLSTTAPLLQVILAVIPKQYITKDTKYHINPCGNFVIGGKEYNFSSSLTCKSFL